MAALEVDRAREEMISQEVSERKLRAVEEANRVIEDEARRSVWMEATRLGARMEAMKRLGWMRWPV